VQYSGRHGGDATANVSARRSTAASGSNVCLARKRSSGGSDLGPSGYRRAIVSGVISSVFAGSWGCPNDQPQLVVAGVVERLAQAVGLNEDRVERADCQ
jgi:hypothetical protein